MTVKLQISGTKGTLKIQTNIENRMNSMRPIEPEKGTQNPPHLQTKLPKSIVKRIVAALTNKADPQ